MSKDIRRVHPRVSYDQNIRLLGNDGKPVIVGRTLNLSPSGIYVRVPQGCEIGSEVTCDLPLPGGTRQIQGRVARTQALPDASTGIGIQFVDLTTGDSSSLHRALEGSGSRPVTVKVLFEGMANPIKCQGVITAEGIRLSTSLPFLRLGSDVQAVYDGRTGQTDARGVLTGVRLEPVAGDGVPRLGVEVDIGAMTAEPESRPTATAASLASGAGDQTPGSEPVSSRGENSASRFRSWNQPPSVRPEGWGPSVTDSSETDAPDTTAVVARPGRVDSVLTRAKSLRAWGFVAVATLAFSIVSAAMYRLAPATGERGAAAPSPVAAVATSRHGTGPVIVRAVAAAAGEETGSAAAGSGSERAAGTTSDRTPDRTPDRTADRTADRTGDRTVDRPSDRLVRQPSDGPGLAPRRARSRQPGSPFRFDATTGRYQLRPGAALDMQGTSLTGIGGLAAADSAAGNLRGINVSIEPGALYFAVPLERAEVDARFGVQVTPSWPTTLAIVGKTTTGFTVSFGTPAPAGAHFDWFLVR